MKSSQRGSAIIMLFIAVALFGMISYAFLQGSRSNMSMLSDEQAKSYAQQIVQLQNDIELGVKRLRARGCKVTDIDFDHAELPFSGNSAGPADKSCDLFSLNGAGLSLKRLPEAMFLSSVDPDDRMAAFYIKIKNIGDDNQADMVFSVYKLRPEICMKINTIFGIANTATDAPGENYSYSGGYDGNMSDGPDDAIPLAIGDDNPALAGKTSFCYHHAQSYNGFPQYESIKVIWAR